MSQGAEKVITKEDIGYPTNFIHTFHVGPDDTVNVDEEDNPFQVIVTSAARPTEQEEESDDEYEETDGSNKEGEKKIITKCDIGDPTDFRHSIHISFSESGSFNIETDDAKLSEFLRNSGVSSEAHLQDEDAAEFVFEFIEKQMEREEDKGNPKYEFLRNFRAHLLENHRTSKEEPTASSSEQEPPHFNDDTVAQEKAADEEHTSKKLTAKVEEQSKKAFTKEDIGHPSNFQHVTHISCNEDDGFIIETNDEILSEFFKKAGVTETDLQDRNTLEFILDYIDKHLQKEKEVSNKEFLKNLKEYLLHFKAKYPALTRRHKKKKKNPRNSSEEDVSRATNGTEQEGPEHAELTQNSNLRSDEIETNEDRGG